GVKDLPLQVAEIDHIRVDDAERADTGGREVVRGRGSEAARSDEQHLAVQKLLLAGVRDFGNQQVTRVALRLVRSEARGCLPRLPGILPAVEATGHRDDVLVAELLERVRGHRRTHTPGAVEDGRLLLFRKAVLRPLLEVALWYVDRAHDVSRVPFVLLADVAELHVTRTDQVLDLLRRRFVDSLFDVGEEVAICRHSSSLCSILNRPVRSEIPDMLGFPRGDAVIRPASVPVPPGPRDPRRWVARARHCRRARSLHLVTVAIGR